GLVADQMRGYFLSEENGSYISVFPIDKKMRYLVPFHDPAEIIGYFREVAAEDGTVDRVVVLADDGEKFGLWPGTHSLCYEENWLRRFCDALRENADWIETTTFSPVLDSARPLGIVYLPTASYSEMMEWALPLRAQISYYRAKQLLEASGDFPEAAEAVRGGLWRNFLVKYEESNWMHKRMLGVSAAVEEAVRKEMSKPDPGAAPDDVEDLDNALSHLYQAQCNCAYWHGLFGGLYLPHLRSAIFSQLIEAENTLEAAGPGDGGVTWSVSDIDGDGVDEVAIRTGSFRAWLKARGGTLRELDSLDPPFNVTDTLTRREEYYHRDVLRLSEGGEAGQGHAVSIHDMAVAKEKGLEKILLYDRHPRSCLVDHFIGRGEDLDSFHSGRYEELGDFVKGIYSIEVDDSGEDPVFLMARDGSVSGPGGKVPVSLSKKISVDRSAATLDVEYSITARGNGLDCVFAVESVFTMLAGNAPDRYFTIPGRDLEMRHLASSGEEPGVGAVTMTDEWMDLSVTLEIQPPAMLWRFPVETVSNSDSGFERVYQGSSLLPLWDLRLDEGQSAAFRIMITLGPAGEAAPEE
ncbi:MAG TPA: alpha-amylase/4-alpha-glucanotransferase domain-containing protein, partial [Candidatus Krumholzibacterium sp.]|nr:alpha-amylase/4-alpha-glucanotransferase domain-containing protein [Candidatus Krumholzibacterium sp.]